MPEVAYVPDITVVGVIFSNAGTPIKNFFEGSLQIEWVIEFGDDDIPAKPLFDPFFKGLAGA